MKQSVAIALMIGWAIGLAGRVEGASTAPRSADSSAVSKRSPNTWRKRIC